MNSSILHRLGAVIGVVAMLLWGVPAGAHADPTADAPPATDTPSGGAVIDAPTISLGDLGQGPTLSFNGAADTTTTELSFPVPQGLAPASLNAILQTPVNLRQGSLTVTQNDRLISRIDLPLTDQAPVVVPLAGAETSGNYVTVTLTVTAIPADVYCWDPDFPVRLLNSFISFSGTESIPTTVAAFVPPVLRKLTIAVPARPSQAESNAAVQLAAAMVAKYGGQNPEVFVTPLPEGAASLATPSLPLERQVIIKEGPSKGLSLRGNGIPSLLVSGQGDELTNQARLLTDDSLRYALSPNTVAGPLQYRLRLAGNTTTLAQLDQAELTSVAMWPQVGITLDQGRFGHPLHNVRLHLLGSYTPVANNMGGEVRVSVAGQTLDRWPADADGVIDRSIEIPDSLLARSTTVDVRINTTGYHGGCGDYLPIHLRITGNSTVAVSPANPPLPPGLRSLPQTLMPRVQIGFGDADTFLDTVRAIQIIDGLQGFSPVPLNATVTSLKQAIAGPDPAIQFGSLQTVFDGKRTLLIATSNGAPRQLDELLGWLGGGPGRWSGLNGRAVISVPGQLPVTVPNESTAVMAAQPDSSDGGDKYSWAWWVAGGVVAVAALGALAILLSARRPSD
ncbi:MAG TPA: hypothetical protein VMD51_11940 [Mycobacterium sp.]|nr:hypothetical protein [Mycobacterium sp.]